MFRRMIVRVVIALIALGVVAVPFSANAQGASQVTREQVDAAIEAIEKAAQNEIETGGEPGIAIGVVFQDELIYAKGFGVREVGKPELVDPDTVFQLASVSKPVGSTVVAKLVGDGKITWDSKISDLDPAFQLYDPWITRNITIRDFYSHRSGLPAHIGDLLEDIGYDRAEVLYRLRFQQPEYPFRTTESYTNFGLTEAAVAAAKAYGLEWEDASEQLLYEPLGMDSTSSRFEDFMARANKAVNHVPVDGKWEHKYQRDPDAQTPAGGVSSSVNDMAKWLRLQLANGKFEGEQVIPEAPLVATHQPNMLRGFSPLNGLPSFDGLGWDLNWDPEGRLRLGHSGGFALGAGTNVALVPAEQLAVVTLTNGKANGVAEALNQIFIETALYGETSQDWLPLYKQVFSNPATLGVIAGFDYSNAPANPTEALANDAYVGTFTNAFYGDVQVIEKDGGMVLVMGPKDMEFPLTHYDRDIFTFETTGENAVGATGVFFDVGPDGTSGSLRVEYLDEYGNGTFQRVQASE